MPSLQKPQILAAAIASITETLTGSRSRARETAESATHDEARQEDQHDTRAIEESYLARGQAQRVADLELEVATLRSLPLQDYADRPVAAGALVTLEDEDEATRIVFLSPTSGGLTVVVDGQEVQFVTPASPLGRALLQAEEGDEVSLVVRGRTLNYTVVDVA